jgi:Tfp pilus assembly protein PilO
MSRTRRRTIIRIVELVAVGVLLLDLVFYFALVRPLRSLRAAEEGRYSAARVLVRQLGLRAERLEKFQAAIPQAEDQLGSFYESHIPSRRQAFSRAARLVRRLTGQASVQLSAVSYKLDTSTDQPLQRLGIEVEVDGPFAGLLNFSHALETAGDFVVVRNFNMHPAEGSLLTLRLDADLYLKP